MWVQRRLDRSWLQAVNAQAATLRKTLEADLVRVSSQTMALQQHLPVLRLHTRVVSRWFAMPMALSVASASTSLNCCSHMLSL